MTSRDRPGMVGLSFPVYNVYRDYVVSTASTPLTVSISGLTPGGEYWLSYSAYDDANTRTMTVADYTSGALGNSASVSWSAGTIFNQDTSEGIFTKTISAVANASGTIILRVTANSGGAMISGLSISKAWQPIAGLCSILPIDFNCGGGAPSPTNVGYLPFVPVSSANQAGPITATYSGLDTSSTSGTVTLTLACGTSLSGSGNFTSRDRPMMAGPTFPSYYLYRDFVTSVASGPVTIGVSGLKPNLSYLIDYTAYNDPTSGTMTITDYTTGTAAASAAVSWTAGTAFGSATNPDLYTKRIPVVSDSQGKLVLRITPAAGGAMISGLEITRTSASWYLASDQGTNQDWSPGYVSSWKSASDGSGVSPSFLTITDTYLNAGHQLRTPVASSSFGGGLLVFSGNAKLVLMTGASGVSSIADFATSDCSIVQGVPSVTQSLTLADYENGGGSTTLSATPGGGIVLTAGTLYGMGDFRLTGGGSFELRFAKASEYVGNIRLLSGTLNVQQMLSTSGGLIVSSSGQVILNSQVYVSSLYIGGSRLGSGVYTYSALHAAYPSIFTSGSGAGQIAVYDVDPASPPSMGGVNLSIAEWGPVPGVYGVNYGYPTEGEFDYYHGKGLNLIRLPFLWERIQPALNGPLDSAELSRIDTMVGYARSRGMKIILDVHNYGRYFGNQIGSTSVPNSAFRDLWRRLADHFKAESAIYGYGLMNEPHDMGGSWPAAAQEAVLGVREVDITHYVIVAGDGWSTAASWETSNAKLFINDPSGGWSMRRIVILQIT